MPRLTGTLGKAAFFQQQLLTAQVIDVTGQPTSTGVPVSVRVSGNGKVFPGLTYPIGRDEDPRAIKGRMVTLFRIGGRWMVLAKS